MLAAEQGDAKAQRAVGDLYTLGWGVPKDERAAAQWFLKAADQGDATAELIVGLLYLTGQGVAHDDSLAAAWFSKAAELGDHDAQANLAYLYEMGRGVPLDLHNAYVWRLLSLDTSTPQNDEKLRKLASQLSRADIAEAERRASEWRLAHVTHPAEIQDLSPDPMQ